jgi:cell division protein FtsX
VLCFTEICICVCCSACVALLQAAIISDICHYLVVFVALVIMFASVFVIAFGTRIEQVASLEVGLVNILQYSLLW